MMALTTSRPRTNKAPRLAHSPRSTRQEVRAARSAAPRSTFLTALLRALSAAAA